MKRFWTSLMFCLFFPAAALAFDASPYLLEPVGVYDAVSVLPISRSEYLREHIYSESARSLIHTLEYWKDGTKKHSLILPQEKGIGYEPFVWRSGDIGVLQRTDRIENSQSWKQDYTLFNLTGHALTHPRSFDGAPYSLLPFHGGFSGIGNDEADQSMLLVYDEQLNLRSRHSLPFSNAHMQAAFQHDGAVFVLVLSHGLQPGVIALCIDADSTAAWTYVYERNTYLYNALYTDGQGGALLTGPVDANYKQQRITHLDAKGKNDWSKTLRAKNAIVYPRLAVPQSDGTIILYGSAVANSRSLFTVFAMALDAHGRFLSVDVRDCSAVPDTEPQIYQAHDGTVFVHTDSVHDVMLVPFDKLPEASNPGITLQ